MFFLDEDVAMTIRMESIEAVGEKLYRKSIPWRMPEPSTALRLWKVYMLGKSGSGLIVLAIRDGYTLVLGGREERRMGSEKVNMSSFFEYWLNNPAFHCCL